MIIANPSGGPTSTDGYSLSMTNVLRGLAPVITNPGVDQDPLNITNPDHSLVYTCGTDAADFEISFGAQTGISYVGLSGHNAATLAGANIEIFNGVTQIHIAQITRNHNLMFSFDPVDFTDLIIKITTVPSTYQTTISYIAAGERLLFTTGEQAGYMRNWLLRPYTQSTTTNLQTAPIGMTQRNKALNGNISFPNSAITTSRDYWQTFEDFSYSEPFFINEVTSLPESSYLAFNPKHSINAHPETRALDVIKMKFNCFNGL
jgi:hypothetical protein